MKSLVSLLIIGSSIFGSLEALLSPYEQRAVELKTIIDSDELRDSLGAQEPIESIEKNKKGYLVTSPHYTVQVILHYEYTGRIGPAKFELKFNRPQKIGN